MSDSPGTSTERETMRKLGAAAVLMGSAVLLSRVIGVFRDSYVASKFGAHSQTDALYNAFTLPDWLNYLVAGGTLSITFLPIYARYLVDKDEREGHRVFSRVGTFAFLFIVTAVVLAEIFADPIVRTVFYRMNESALLACVRYTRILLPAQIFFVLGGLCAATLYARLRFWAAAIGPLFYNVGIIVGAYALGDRLGPESMAWGALAGAFAGPFLWPAVDAFRAGARFRPTFGFRHPAFVEWIKLSLPLMVGVTLVTVDDWIIRYFASGQEGAVTHLNYAKRIAIAAIAIAGQAVGQASMPFFARLFASGRREDLADTCVRTVRGAGVLSMLAAAGLLALAQPVTQILYGRHQYTPSDVASTSFYLLLFAAAVPAWAIQSLIVRVFYAARNTLTPMVAGTIVTVVSFPVYALLFRRLGTTGLALGSGVGIVLHTLVIFGLAPRILPEIRARLWPLAGDLARGLALSAFAGIGAHVAARFCMGFVAWETTFGALVQFLVGGAVFVAVTLAFAEVLGVPDPKHVLAKLTQRLR